MGGTWPGETVNAKMEFFGMDVLIPAGDGIHLIITKLARTISKSGIYASGNVEARPAFFSSTVDAVMICHATTMADLPQCVVED